MWKRAVLYAVLTLVLAACGQPTPTPTPTPTPIPLQELRQTGVYYASTGSVIREYLPTLDSALETASVDSTITIYQSLDAGAANLQNLWRFQDNVEALRVRFLSMPPPPVVALEFDTLMRESNGYAKKGLGALVSGYEKYAMDRGFPTREDVEEFVKTRARGEAFIKVAAAKAAKALEESNRILDETLAELDRRDPSGEQKYLIFVDAIVDAFYNHRKDYNAGVERTGGQVRSARTQADHRWALEQAVAHLEDAHRWFRQDRDDFARILPPSRFREFHLLMNSALNDYVGATSAFVTYYSQNLNQGTQDMQLANRASALIRTANESLQRAGYMYAELLAQR